ncbi:hypothetical protein HPP92_018127 [Vanilla planifolia]|uniref:Uncharacterized protein n=1 Tax=Vanilla planifolia TaxID=51239 RepID=A0A835QAJ3_VANPL|nr:hypothetical protein HPP92_018714 [Vanilla planifolia]KAG0468799.1 hypothetical protein HPP92_018127 [Vanilla planifolia]
MFPPFSCTMKVQQWKSLLFIVSVLHGSSALLVCGSLRKSTRRELGFLWNRRGESVL